MADEKQGEGEDHGIDTFRRQHCACSLSAIYSYRKKIHAIASIIYGTSRKIFWRHLPICVLSVDIMST